VGPDGEAFGVDFSGLMIDQARGRSEAAGLPVHFEVGDSQKLRFADDTFAACRTERMLCHVPDTGAVLAEMIRVVRPGGTVVAIDVDLEAALLDAPDLGFTRMFFSSFADTLSHGRMARELPRHFRLAGLDDVTVFPLLAEMEFDFLDQLVGPHFDALRTGGTIDLEQADRWWAYLQDAGATGIFFMAVPMVVIAGRKP
jgi:ubiquinone/menaquinone biosynthesis C-methylase UbiE